MFNKEEYSSYERRFGRSWSRSLLSRGIGSTAVVGMGVAEIEWSKSNLYPIGIVLCIPPDHLPIEFDHRDRIPKRYVLVISSV